MGEKLLSVSQGQFINDVVGYSVGRYVGPNGSLTVQVMSVFGGLIPLQVADISCKSPGKVIEQTLGEPPLDLDVQSIILMTRPIGRVVDVRESRQRPRLVYI